MNNEESDPGVKAKWVHDHELSFGQIKEKLEFCRDAMRGAINQKKAELRGYEELRNSFKRR